MSKMIDATNEFEVKAAGQAVLVNAWRPDNVFVGGERGLAYEDADRRIRINPAALLGNEEAVASRLVQLGIDGSAAADLCSEAQKRLRAMFHQVSGNGGVIVSIHAHGVRITPTAWDQAQDIAKVRGCTVEEARAWRPGRN